MALAMAAGGEMAPPSPEALDPERVARRRVLEVDGLDGRQFHGRRHQIVEKRAGQELALVVVDHLLEERPAHALGHPAVHLALDDERIDHLAAVVGDEVSQQA